MSESFKDSRRKLRKASDFTHEVVTARMQRPKTSMEEFRVTKAQEG
jgi:hypothetical protein